MVIQCPVCSTKFSVDSAEIADRRDPQFHCSRCDCLFDLKGKSKSSSVKNKSLADEIVASSNSIEIPSLEKGVQGSIFAEEILANVTEPTHEEAVTEETQMGFFEAIADSAPTVKTKNSFLRFDDEEDFDLREDLPLIAAEWPDARADRDLEIDLGEVARRSMPFASTKRVEIGSDAITLPNKRELIESELVTATAPRLSIPPKNSWHKIEEESISELALTPTTSGAENSHSENVQRIFDELERSSTPAEVQNATLNQRFKDEIPTFLEKDQGYILNFPVKEKTKAGKIETPKKRFSMEKIELPKGMIGAMKFNQKMLSASSIRTMSLFLIGPAVSTLALYAASVSPLTNLIPGTNGGLKAPPSGLELQALKSEVKVLADGTQFLEVTGNILNNTPATYSSVELIARSFDQQNQKSSEILVDVNNGLQHLENAEALKAEMLMKLQKEKGIARVIKPNDKVEVRLALPIDSELPAYFDAEIFAVKKS